MVKRVLIDLLNALDWMNNYKAQRKRQKWWNEVGEIIDDLTHFANSDWGCKPIADNQKEHNPND